LPGLAARPAILILDDALAAWTPTPKRILAAFQLYRASTTILISHRVSTVRNADQIAVLDRGALWRLDA